MIHDLYILCMIHGLYVLCMIHGLYVLCMIHGLYVLCMIHGLYVLCMFPGMNVVCMFPGMYVVCIFPGMYVHHSTGNTRLLTNAHLKQTISFGTDVFPQLPRDTFSHGIWCGSSTTIHTFLPNNILVFV